MRDTSHKPQAMIPRPDSCAVLQRLQPDDRAGTIHDRDQRRRPHDRRQQRLPILFDMRTEKGERRRSRRRAVYDPGRRRWPEPPAGIDVWV